MTEKDEIVKDCGRIRYIEPNNLFTSSKKDKVQNGIPQPYEDYSLSVNLRVINGNRYDCGMTDEGDDITNRVLEFSSDRGTLSFLDGTAVNGGQGYLTTNFTDISMNNPETNTKECLGIESISIRYDSWYTPTVDIKFTDVRGASLMLPAEYEYYNNGGPNVGKNDSTTSNSDFFKAFFSFPYPLFKLSIKGFYGREVTYDLSVTKCNIDFNSTNGNFEVFASFIGYMYGLYADIPFTFLYLAPYIDLYGKNTWEEKTSKTGDFRYITESKKDPYGRQMYTFPELKHAVEDAGKNIDAEQGNSESGKCRTEGTELLKKLNNEVLAYYPLGQSAWWSWSKNNKDGYFFLIAEDENKTNRKTFEDFNKFTKSLMEYNNLAAESENRLHNFKDKEIKVEEVFENIYARTEEVGKKKPGDETLNKQYSDEEVKEILKGQIVTLKFTKNTDVKDKPTLTFEVGKSDFGTASQYDYQPLINELKQRFDKNEHNTPMSPNLATKEWTIKALIFKNTNYRNVIVETHNDINKYIVKLANDLAKQRETDIEKTIGFTPSMKNMFNMMFAHTDTFMSTFYNTLERIRKSIVSSSDNSRKRDILCGANGNIQVDVNENTLKSKSSNGGKLPPFTMFYKEETEKDSKDKKVTMIWPGSIVGGEKLDEVKLVEAIINATALNKRRYESVTEKHNIIDRRGNLVPITYYDIENKDKNPYLDVITRKSLTDNRELINDILKVFMTRCYYAFLNGNYVGGVNDATMKARLIAELEVGNIVRAFQLLKTKPTRNFITQLLQAEKVPSSVYGNINGNEKMFKEKGTNLIYNQITDNLGNIILPVGDFTPTTISNAIEKIIPEESAGDFIRVSETGTTNNGVSCKIHPGGNFIEDVFAINSTGDFVRATKLFPTYKKLSSTISDVAFYDAAFRYTMINETLNNRDNYKSVNTLYERKEFNDLIKGIPDIPSFRRSEAGVTNIFMDPLYYAQTSREARAYLFLFGVPYGKNKDFFLPEKIENGDYPTLMLLREGALWWRYNTQVKTKNDPMVYTYTINGVEKNLIDDIKNNDPCLGRERYIEYYTGNTATQARKSAAENYFLAWVNGDPNDETSEYDVFPSISFQEIERYFALWAYATGGTNVTQQILSYFGNNGILMSVTREKTNNFANGKTLREVYDVPNNGKLGKLAGNLRTDVFINPRAIIENYVLTDDISREVNDFMQRFRNFYVGFDTIIDYTTFDNPNSNYSVPKGAITNALTTFIKGLAKEYDEDIDTLKEATGTTSEGEIEDKPEEVDYFNDTDLKLACYIALKNLYDRWLCSRRRESWTFSCDAEKMRGINGKINSDFLRFYYIDEFYHNIGLKVRPNLTNFIETASKLGGFTEKSDETDLMSRSLLKMLSTTAQYGGCSLLTLPTALGMGKTDSKINNNNSIADVFRAFPYNEAVKTDAIETSFIVLYSSEKSSVLNVENESGTMAYKSDGFDIANTWGEINDETAKLFEMIDDDDFVVPAFGVTFAKQNQSYFSNINLSMNDHQVTEYSLRTELMVSYENNRGPRETSVVGQDLYSVFSNYSYSCNVEMLGDAQITPLMYFQLNNIPMWKGAYLITNVHHDITYEGMNTVFTGVRQARPTLPFKDNKLTLAASDIEKDTPQSQNNPDGRRNPNNCIDMSEMPLNKLKVEEIRNTIFSLDRSSMSTDGKWFNGVMMAQVWYNDELDKPVEFITIGRTKEQTTNNRTPLPQGRFDIISAFTNNMDSKELKHIIISGSNLDGNVCEFSIEGETTMKSNISPIIIYENETTGDEIDTDMLNAIYDDIFDFVKRMTEARKGISFSVIQGDDIQNKRMDI